jgi:redox-sensitive bicupin YhaK (pirin superfamily)
MKSIYFIIRNKDKHRFYPIMSQKTINYQIHRSDLRGRSQTNWLDSYHTFSFSHFYDANRMGFRSLRVINEDRIAPGGGFATHGHKDMEILTYVLSGAVGHQDSLGTGATIHPGEVQVMSAGTGILHSEFNHSQTEELHLLQIWILPNQQNLTPRYEQKALTLKENAGNLCLIASEDGRNGSVTIHQDISLFAAILDKGDLVKYHLSSQRYAWLQIARGAVNFAGIALFAGDGVEIEGETQLEISTDSSAEILLFDLA